MMLSPSEVISAAEKLTEAQRKIVLGCRSDGFTRHPSAGNTRKALNERGIMHGFKLTSFGCQVRNYLEMQQSEADGH